MSQTAGKAAGRGDLDPVDQPERAIDEPPGPALDGMGAASQPAAQVHEREQQALEVRVAVVPPPVAPQLQAEQGRVVAAAVPGPLIHRAPERAERRRRYQQLPARPDEPSSLREQRVGVDVFDHVERGSHVELTVRQRSRTDIRLDQRRRAAARARPREQRTVRVHRSHRGEPAFPDGQHAAGPASELHHGVSLAHDTIEEAAEQQPSLSHPEMIIFVQRGETIRRCRIEPLRQRFGIAVPDAVQASEACVTGKAFDRVRAHSHPSPAARGAPPLDGTVMPALVR